VSADISGSEAARQGAIATYTKTCIGKSATITPVRAAGATDIPAPAFGVLNTTSNVGRIGFNGSTISGPNFVLAASFNVNNNYRAQKSLGVLGAVGIGNGQFTVTRQLQTYFGDATIYDQILNNTQVSFDTRLGRWQSRDAAVRLSRNQAVVRLAVGRRHESGRHDPGRVHGVQAHDARIHGLGRPLLVSADVLAEVAT